MTNFNDTPILSEKITALIDRALTANNEKEIPRNYLGASRLGVECSRALQYEYFNTPKDEGRNFKGRTLRIFQAGHVFEDLMIKWLRGAGFNLIDKKPNGEQFGFSVLDGKVKGHIDCVVQYAPVELGLFFPMLGEIKSLNDRSWKDTVKKGVKKSKPIYAGQIALYQAYLEKEFKGIHKNPALFIAINKNTAELYFELVPFDGKLAQMCSDKGYRIIEACEAHELLPRVTKDPGSFKCRFCDWQDRCWQTED